MSDHLSEVVSELKRSCTSAAEAQPKSRAWPAPTRRHWLCRSGPCPRWKNPCSFQDPLSIAIPRGPRHPLRPGRATPFVDILFFEFRGHTLYFCSISCSLFLVATRGKSITARIYFHNPPIPGPYFEKNPPLSPQDNNTQIIVC